MSKRVDTGYTDTRKMSLKALQKRYAVLTKRANARIETLHQKGRSGSPAYNKYVENLKGASYLKERKGKTVFQAVPKKGISKMQQVQELRAAIAKAEMFLDAKTSTISGIKEVNAAKRDNIKGFLKSTGKFTDEDKEFLDQMTDDEIDEFLNFLGSDTVNKARKKSDYYQIISVVGQVFVRSKEYYAKEEKKAPSLMQMWRNMQEQGRSLLGTELAMQKGTFKF